MFRSELSKERKKTYRVVQRTLKRFLYYKSQTEKGFTLNLDDITEITLIEIESFFISEPDLKKLNPNIKRIFRNYKNPDQRAENTSNGFLRMIRAAFNWSIKNERTTNYPFKKF